MPFSFCPFRGFPALLCCIAHWLGANLLAGCVSTGNPSAVDQDRISQIKLDISTTEDVRRILGQPNGMSRHSGNYSAALGLPATTISTTVEVWT